MAEEENDEKFVLAEDVEEISKNTIPNHHPELATARIQYLFTSKAPKKGGRELMGKVSKVSGRWEYLTELDFIVEVARPVWRVLDNAQRRALVDHLLEHCVGEDDEEDGGTMKWSLREPDVREFSTILRRHGAWNDNLTTFVSVAQTIDISSMVDEALDDTLDLSEEEEDLTVGEDEG